MSIRKRKRLNNGESQPVFLAALAGTPFSIKDHFERRGTPLASALFELGTDPSKHVQLEDQTFKKTMGSDDTTLLLYEGARMKSDLAAQRAAAVQFVHSVDGAEQVVDDACGRAASCQLTWDTGTRMMSVSDYTAQYIRLLCKELQASWDSLPLDVIKDKLRITHVGDITMINAEHKEEVLDAILEIAHTAKLAKNAEFRDHIRALKQLGVLSSDFYHNYVLHNKHFTVESKAGLVGIYLNLDNSIEPFEIHNKSFHPQEKSSGMPSWSRIET